MEVEATEEEEIAAIDHELSQIDAKIVRLTDRKEILSQRKKKLRDQILRRKSEDLSGRNWSQKTFAWSKEVDSILENVFKIKEFRPLQLEAINATMSKEDTILVLPTGGGKSLCYQLPALLESGITLVVSPLVSLMEDQMIGLKRLNIPAVMLSANSSKEDTKLASNALQDPKSLIKLIYATPEKLAKSKRFMSQLQKCSEQGRFKRLAIDEVHCCSVWGHDFRPDYNYLGVLKDMFPTTPILGLTATSTSKVTVDVQRMLNIQGCLVLKSTFNRSNLHYEVIPKPSSQDECLNILEDWLTNRFKDKTGIIYTTQIKDCDEMTKELKKRGLRVGIYHAMLDAEVRSKMHMKWMSGEIQVIIATIAFGLGIDKPDVRFVIHHTLSKSMENYYQESGRSGRDGNNSHCILMYRLADVFKLSTMVFTQQTGLDNLYGMLSYCLDSHQCRRQMIAEHFEEDWNVSLCNKMCDHCQNPREFRAFDATAHCRNLYRIIQHALELDVKLTTIKLLDAWYGKGESKLRIKDISAPSFDKTTAEKIVGYLLVESYLKEDFHYTAYSTISYLKRGPRSVLLEDKNHRIVFKFSGVKCSNSFKASPRLTSKVSGQSESPKLSAKSTHDLDFKKDNEVEKRNKDKPKELKRKSKVPVGDDESDVAFIKCVKQ